MQKIYAKYGMQNIKKKSKSVDTFIQMSYI